MTSKLAYVVLSAVSLLTMDLALARGPWRSNEANTTGWQFMTPEERIEHQARIRGFRNYDECHAYQLEHHQLMESRAAEKGQPSPGNRRDFCEHLKAQSTTR